MTRAASTLADLPLFARARATDPASSHAAAERAQRTGIASAQRLEALRLVATWPGHTASELAALACDDDAESRELTISRALRTPRATDAAGPTKGLRSRTLPAHADVQESSCSTSS